MSANPEKIVEYLMNNPIVSKVYYSTELKHGNGHVVSFELKDHSYELAEAFYDNCTIQTKGTIMGLEKSMLMPYAFITHYHDSIEAHDSMGLNNYIVRLSVGTGTPDIII